MDSLRLRVRAFERAPAADDAELEHLAEWVRRTVAEGRGGAVAVAIRAERTEWIDLSGLAQRVPLPRFLAGLTRSRGEAPGDGATPGTPLAVGVAGRFVVRRRGAPVERVALAFLEWPDCRWTLWRTSLDGSGAVVADSELRRSATAGDPLPDGLGRWWTLGRRLQLEVQMGPIASAETTSPLVH